MSTSTPLPPTARDFLAFQRIVIDQASTRQVAHELEISQTRVRQVVRRAGEWFQQNLPSSEENLDAAKLQLAQHIAADRLDRYLREADQAWRQTQETKYANLVIRLLTAQSKSPALPGTLEALAADAILGPLPDEPLTTPTRNVSEGEVLPKSEIPIVPNPKFEICNSHFEIDAAQPSIQNPKSEFQNPTPPPPPRDCSHAPPPPPPSAPNLPPTIASTPPPQTPSTNAPPSAQSARKRFLAPAQPLATDTEDSLITELRITPQKLAFQPNRPLNRRERRRLHRATKK